MGEPGGRGERGSHGLPGSAVRILHLTSSATLIWSGAETWSCFLLRVHLEKLELQEHGGVQDLLGESVYQETGDHKERLENRFMVSFSCFLLKLMG